MTKKPEAYPLRYVEDFFGVSNEVAVKLSKCATGDHFSPPCQGSLTGKEEGGEVSSLRSSTVPLMLG
jgi:hypothetical protein